MLFPINDCIYLTKNNKCNHLDRGRGFLGLGKYCVLTDDFVSGCKYMIKQEIKVSWHEPPPPKNTNVKEK